jgi:hypothetical protein
MPSVIVRFLLFMVPLGPLGFLAWSVRRWLRTAPRIVSPAWRSYFAFAATSLAGVSVLVWIVVGIWAQAIGWFPFYDPVLMRLYAWGFLTGFAGLVAGLVGKGKLRWPACGVSALMTFLWLAWMAGE